MADDSQEDATNEIIRSMTSPDTPPQDDARDLIEEAATILGNIENGRYGGIADNLRALLSRVPSEEATDFNAVARAMQRDHSATGTEEEIETTLRRITRAGSEVIGF